MKRQVLALLLGALLTLANVSAPAFASESAETLPCYSGSNVVSFTAFTGCAPVKVVAKGGRCYYYSKKKVIESSDGATDAVQVYGLTLIYAGFTQTDNGMYGKGSESVQIIENEIYIIIKLRI